MSARGGRAVLLAVALGVAWPSGVEAQMFLASTPHPDFGIGPLFVVASIRPELTPVTVTLSWSLTPARRRRPAEIHSQDLYLLWPAEIAESTAPGPPDPSLGRYLEQRGFVVVSGGRLVLRGRDRLQLGTGAMGEPVREVASYVNFVRGGQAQAQLGVGAYVKIPWTPKLVDPLSVVTLALPLQGLIAPKAATWVEELFWGRRNILTVGFGDVGPPVLPLYPFYFEHRDRVVPLAPESSMIIATFADSDHLRIEEVAPAAATRRQSRVRAGSEVVALTLSPSEGITPQTARVQFSYFSGRIAWRPIVIAAVFLLLGNFTGVMLLSKDASRVIRQRLRARNGRQANGQANPGWLEREALAALVPGTTTYGEVVSRCGRPVEERERVVPPGRRTLVYRARRGQEPMAEEQEVEVTLEGDRVHEVVSCTRR